jgi:predicted CoA-binding protein
METNTRTVVVLGASDKEDRYSNKAQKLLMERGYSVVPVHPSLSTVEGVPVTHSLSDVPRYPDVVTVYVNPDRSSALSEEFETLSPKAVIFNPGTENPELEARLVRAGIRVVQACTIVLSRTGQFEETVFPAETG